MGDRTRIPVECYPSQNLRLVTPNGRWMKVDSACRKCSLVLSLLVLVYITIFIMKDERIGENIISLSFTRKDIDFCLSFFNIVHPYELLAIKRFTSARFLHTMVYF